MVIAARLDGVYFAKVRCTFDLLTVTDKNVACISTAQNLFMPLVQSTVVSRVGLNYSHCGSAN